jgi:hypothetical protein
VCANIDRYLEYCDNERITLTVRPAIGLLTIGSYHTLLKYCIEKKLVVKGLLVHNPDYLDARILPMEIRSMYKKYYEQLIVDYNLESVDCTIDYNNSDPNQILRIVKTQIVQCINLLNEPSPLNSQQLLHDMVQWCRRWDNVYGYNALELYPELSEIFVNNGY